MPGLVFVFAFHFLSEQLQVSLCSSLQSTLSILFFRQNRNPTPRKFLNALPILFLLVKAGKSGLLVVVRFCEELLEGKPIAAGGLCGPAGHPSYRGA